MVRPRISKTAKLTPVLAVGGLDPSGFAGILADDRVFERLGLTYRVAVSALTVQTEKKFFSWEPVPLPMFKAQLEAAGSRLSGVKIGMLGTPRHLAALLVWLRRVRPRFVVWDPVLRSSTGARLFRGRRSDPGIEKLWKLCDALTPNLPEAEWLLGRKVTDSNSAERAATELFRRGEKSGRFVVLKGGHSSDPKQAVDWLASAGKILSLCARRRPGSRRGSGCSFASALLAGLIFGKDPRSAARFAKRYVLKNLFDYSTPQRFDSKLSKRN